jgi:hypothetical protein
MRIQIIKSLMAALTLLMVIGCSKSSTVVSVTADMVQDVNNRQIEGKIFIKGNEYRMDINEKKEKLSILVNRESGKQQLLIHSQKVAQEYLNTSSKSLSNNPFEYFNSLLEQYSSREEGTEVINGYECKKIEVYRGDKKLSTAWISKELNWPIKIETAMKPIKDIDLKNIKEETVKASLFQVPKDYKFYPLPEPKKENPQDKEKLKQEKLKRLEDVKKMKEAVLKKLEEQGIERENKDGEIGVREFGATVLKMHFPDWKFFRVVREKETEDSSSSGSIWVANATVSKDIKTVYILESPKADTPVDIRLKIFQNQNIKLNDEKAVEKFGKALVGLYFRGTRIEDVESLGENKWAIYLRTGSGDLSGFIVKVNNSGEVTELDYKLQIE